MAFALLGFAVRPERSRARSTMRFWGLAAWALPKTLELRGSLRLESLLSVSQFLRGPRAPL